LPHRGVMMTLEMSGTLQFCEGISDQSMSRFASNIAHGLHQTKIATRSGTLSSPLPHRVGCAVLADGRADLHPFGEEF
jgi:hypothetical protein